VAIFEDTAAGMDDSGRATYVVVGLFRDHPLLRHRRERSEMDGSQNQTSISPSLIILTEELKSDLFVVIVRKVCDKHDDS
jgi:hypothetical protein